ncbi:MAG: hypothetical protein C0599_12890 [Salinivirgaceae bacterium]|nr:MAG: hypothetical protein C0599_12890 [Salinivirgaceae bacterium]
MKNLLFTLLISSLLFISCDIDEDKTYDQTDLYGTWIQINPDPADSGFNYIHHTFSSSVYESSSYPYDVLYNYGFTYNWDDSGEVTWENLLGMTVRLKIQTLNSNTLSFKKYVGGIFDDEYTCTKLY